MMSDPVGRQQLTSPDVLSALKHQIDRLERPTLAKAKPGDALTLRSPRSTDISPGRIGAGIPSCHQRCGNLDPGDWVCCGPFRARDTDIASKATCVVVPARV